MSELFRIDNTESMGTRGTRLWVQANQVLNVGGGYFLLIHFDANYPEAAPVAVLQNHNGSVYRDELHPGAFVDLARWTGLLVIPRATQVNRRGGALRLMLDFVYANRVAVG